MTPLETAFGIFLGLLILLIMGVGLWAMLGPQPQYKPLSYEDEVKWLMETHGMTREQAEEIANL